MADKGFKRKLTAILSADAVGYSRLMAEDEASTVRTMASYREIISSLVRQHRGRVVDSPGDNVLAEFASVVDAVQCAVAIQNEIETRNAELVDCRRMAFRIGINLGDVIDEEDRIYGDGVNIAARLESLAEPGGICVSKTAFDQIETKLPLGYEYLGEQPVKNIPKPVGAYRVLMKPDVAGKVIGENRFLGRFSRKTALVAIAVLIVIAGAMVGWNVYLQQSKKVAPASADKMAFPLPEEPSIAVLPFDNMSGDSKQDYFSDGLTDQVISALSKVPELFVIGRNSTFIYKGTPVKVQRVAEELGVRYVLEGSVRKSEDKVRITAQLIDALSGRHLWSDSYDRELKDIFDLQDEITMKILTAMQVELTAGEQARMTGKGTKSLKAYLKFLESADLFFRFSKEANVRAKQLNEEAIALDPEFAAAHSFLGICHLFDALYGWSKSPPKSLDNAFKFSRKALSLDDSLTGPYVTLSMIYVFQGKHENAVAEARHAVEIGPNAANAVANLGWVLRCSGQPEEGISLMKKAMRLDPIPKVKDYDMLGRAYFLTERYEEAIAEYGKAVSLNPDYRDAHVGLAATYAILGRDVDARAEVAEIVKIDPSFSIKKYAKSMRFQVGIESEIEGLRLAGAPE